MPALCQCPGCIEARALLGDTDPLQVACPTCGQPIAAGCMDPRGLAQPPHAARRTAYLRKVLPAHPLQRVATPAQRCALGAHHAVTAPAGVSTFLDGRLVPVGTVYCSFCLRILITSDDSDAAPPAAPKGE